MGSGMRKLLVARVADRPVGFLTDHLAEISPLPRLYPLPVAYPYLRATAFLKGQLVTVLDTPALVDEPPAGEGGELLLRLASPLGNLALTVSAVEDVVAYDELALREEKTEGIWGGLYPWNQEWVGVINPSAVAAELSRAMALSVHYQTAGRDHAS